MKSLNIRALCRAGAALSVLLFAAPRAALAQNTEGPSLDDRLAWIGNEFEHAISEHHAPGAALAVVKDGRVVLLQGYGLADLDTRRPVTPDTRFAIGSTTKAFTATAIGMLADDGRMSFDEPVRTHLPEFHLADPDADSKVTIRDLLCHRVGFAVMNPTWYGVPDVTRDDIIRIMGRAELLYPFRTKWNYSNESFLAAGMAAANAAGTDWDTLIAARILKPLGMTETNTTYAAAQADPLMATGYRWDAAKAELVHQPMRNADAVGPAGSINSSARDMAEWVAFQLARGEIGGAHLITQDTLEQTWTKQIDVSPDIGYAMGWMLRQWEGRRAVEHAGGIDGFTAEVALLPDDNAGLVMLTNQFASPLQELSRELVFRGLLGDISDTNPAAPPEDFARLTGNYTANFGPFKNATMKVLLKDGKLAVDVPGQMVYELRPPRDDGKRPFVLTDAIAVRFNQNDQDQVYSFTIFQSGMAFECFREGDQPPVEPPVEIDLAKARDCLGVYHLDAPGQERDVTVVIEHNRLAIDDPTQMVYELNPPDEAGWMTFRITDTIKVRFDRDDAGKAVSITQQQSGVETVLPRVGDLPEAEQLPTVEELLARAADAGVIDTRHAIHTLTLEGTINAVNMGLSGPERAVYTDDGRLYTSLDLGGGRLTETWINPDHALTRSFATGETELTPAQRAAARLQSPLTWARDWRESFDSAAVTERTTFDDRDAYALRVTLGEQEATMLLDAQTAMPLAIRATTDNSLGGSLPVTIRLTDWREVAGVKIPCRQETEIPMAGTLRTAFTHAEANTPADDSVFRAPVVMGED